MRVVADLASTGGRPGRVAAILRHSRPVLTALFASRQVAVPEWRLSAGAVRDANWDVLHARPPTAMPREMAGCLVVAWRRPSSDSSLWLEGQPELQAQLEIEHGA